VKVIEEQMTRELAACRNLPGVKDVRVKGAIGVVEMERIAELHTLRARFVEEGVFIRPFGNVIYLTPSFTIAPDELTRLTRAIVKVVQS
jgi:adenosylmethionine-8-amino-7-oxononanoate aminotransferase